MKNINVQSIFGISVALVLGAAVAFAGSQGGASFNGMPVFVICGLLAFGMNWLGYIPSYIAQTEHYYDFMGSVTYVTLLLVAVTLTEEMTTRSIAGGTRSYDKCHTRRLREPDLCVEQLAIAAERARRELVRGILRVGLDEKQL